MYNVRWKPPGCGARGSCLQRLCGSPPLLIGIFELLYNTYSITIFIIQCVFFKRAIEFQMLTIVVEVIFSVGENWVGNRVLWHTPGCSWLSFIIAFVLSFALKARTGNRYEHWEPRTYRTREPWLFEYNIYNKLSRAASTFKNGILPILDFLYNLQVFIRYLITSRKSTNTSEETAII